MNKVGLNQGFQMDFLLGINSSQLVMAAWGAVRTGVLRPSIELGEKEDCV